MKYFSMFSGIGGFEYGINRSFDNEYAPVSQEPQQEECSQGGFGATSEQQALLLSGNRTAPLCIGYSEIDKYANAIYRYHFPEHRNFGDATRIVPSGIPDFDILVGGFPCQAFSIAGKRKGFDDTRGTLFFEIARILTDKRPKHLLLENVKGLLSHDLGRTFRTILGVLADLGYFVEWQVLNSKDFGVPQNRERVFLIGHLGGLSGQTVFPIGESDQVDIGEVDRLHHSRPASALRATDYKGTHNVIRTIGNMYPSGSENGQILDTNGISKTLKSGETSNPDYGGVGSCNSPKILDSHRIRRLTPIECERLQCFPDNYTKYGLFENEVKEISDTQRYKTLGNAVTTNVIQAIINQFLKVKQAS